LGVDWAPLGTLWLPFGCLLDPFGCTLCTPLGSLWQSLAPLGLYFEDFGIILGSSDCRKGPKSDEERCWDVVFVNSLIYYVSFDEQRTLTGAVTTCLCQFVCLFVCLFVRLCGCVFVFQNIDFQ
jgi:hypothetical protein